MIVMNSNFEKPSYIELAEELDNTLTILKQKRNPTVTVSGCFQSRKTPQIGRYPQQLHMRAIQLYIKEL